MTRPLMHDPAQLSRLVRGLDLLSVGIAAQAASVLRFGPAAQDLPPAYSIMQYAAIGIAYLLLPRFGLYDGWHTRPAARLLAQLCAGWTGTLAALILLSFALHLAGNLSRMWLWYWYGAGVLLMVAVRAGVRCSLPYLYRHGWSGVRVVLVGGGSIGRQLLAAARGGGRYDYTVQGWCPAPGEPAVAPPAGIEALAHADHLHAYLRQHPVDEIWIALPMSEAESVVQLQRLLRHHFMEVRWIIDTGALHVLRTNMDSLFGFPLLNLNCPDTGAWHRIGKLVFDKVFALAVLVLLAPLYLAICIGVKCSSPGPACFRQRRVGLNGAEFTVYKFRSMRLHDDGAGKVLQATANDARVTRFGAFLRRTSLDELPQFLNVLLGDMSVVGPRPHAVAHMTMYDGLLDNYMMRHRAKPGITGWAQINGCRGETDTLEKMFNRVQYDLYYIRHSSLWLDLRIVLWTAFRGWTGANAY